jgi:hypothetical protein
MLFVWLQFIILYICILSHIAISLPVQYKELGWLSLTAGYLPESQDSIPVNSKNIFSSPYRPDRFNGHRVSFRGE